MLAYYMAHYTYIICHVGDKMDDNKGKLDLTKI